MKSKFEAAMFRKSNKVYVQQWKAARAFLLAWLILLPLHGISKFTNAAQRNEPWPWELLLYLSLMMLFGVLLVSGLRRWFNFLAGEEVCKWRYPK
ncbi:hypothetical protein VCJ71_00445 [Alteriqipengyuania sp. WL0013]|uniref:hypothetical protein n=1 Tax=Alteriqipengyuania sp. WL0013 TaxID=3110773 RepID=UPI002C222F8B|nr:hypothetical protein [Alteriqipengyuania sp. WL0013]MEB3414523.1 hypothetical protein [Alteriqipengyuania sp. WL0013]